ncbi:MAG: hypothetical protein ACI81Q_001297 [Paracoccaceae bacterium]
MQSFGKSLQNCHDFLTQDVDTGAPFKMDLPMSSPIIGAALGVADLLTYANWRREKDRDLKLQTFHEGSVRGN